MKTTAITSLKGTTTAKITWMKNPSYLLHQFYTCLTGTVMPYLNISFRQNWTYADYLKLITKSYISTSCLKTKSVITKEHGYHSTCHSLRVCRVTPTGKTSYPPWWTRLPHTYFSLGRMGTELTTPQ